MRNIFYAAVALMLVFEGVLPFLAPAVWRRLFQRMTELSDAQLRLFGLSSMIVGLIILVVCK